LEFLNELLGHHTGGLCTNNFGCGSAVLDCLW
jgi:hypothetical protein